MNGRLLSAGDLLMNPNLSPDGRPICRICSLEAGLVSQKYCSGCGACFQSPFTDLYTQLELLESDVTPVLEIADISSAISSMLSSFSDDGISPTELSPTIPSTESSPPIRPLPSQPPRPPPRPRLAAPFSSPSESTLSPPSRERELPPPRALPLGPGHRPIPSPIPSSIPSSSPSGSEWMARSPPCIGSPPPTAPRAGFSSPARPPRPSSSLNKDSAKMQGEPLPVMDAYFHSFPSAYVRLTIDAPAEGKVQHIYFTPYSMVSDAIEQIQSLFWYPESPSTAQLRYGLYNPITRTWLSLSRTLFSFRLADNYRLEFMARPDSDRLNYAKVTILENFSSSTLPVDEETTGWDLTIKLLSKYNDVRLSDDVVRPPALRLLPHLLQLFIERGMAPGDAIDEDQPVRVKCDKGQPVLPLRFDLPLAIHDSLARMIEQEGGDLPLRSSSVGASTSSDSGDLKTSSLSRLKRKDAWFGGSKSNIKLQTAPSVSKGKPTAVQKHSLPSSAPGTLPSETLMLQITNLEALVDEPSQTKSFYFDPLLPIERCVKRILKTYPFSLDVGQFGFFDVKQSTSPEGRWLDNKRTFASYQLQNNDILEFKKRYISYGVSLAGNLKPYYQFDARATVGQLREIIEHNYLETGLIKDAARGSEYGLYIPGDHEGELENRRSLFSYNILNMQLIEYRRRLQPLTIFEAGRQAVFQVDYLKPLGLLEAEVCAKFLLERFDQSSCSLQQHGIIGVSVNLNQSLVYQNIRPPATLIMKVNRAPSASSEAQQDDPSMLTNIYEEPDDERFIKYEKAPTATTAPVIMACSFNKIVTHLTHEKWSDLSFMGALLLTFRVFTTPSNLLQKLIERYNAPVCLPKAESAVIKLRVLNFLRKWVIDWPQDFEGGAKDILIDFVQFQVTNAPDVSSVSKSTCLKIVKKLTQDQQPGSTVRRKAPKASRSLRTTVFIGNAVDKHGSIFDFPEDDIAAELTRIDTDIYQGLSASEFLGQNWAKEATQMKCPTIMEMITRFNAISMWVAFLILEPVGFQLRAKRFEKLIRIADVLLERNNFQTLMAFLGGMNNASVSRLKFTKEVLSKKAVAKLTELEKLMNMESSYAKYREALTQRQPPIIPYVGVYLSDLTFVEDGNPDQIDGLINFSKYQLAYDTISKIETYKVVKSTPSPSPENTEICRVLLDIPLHSEKQLYEMSLEREPRGAVKCTP